jgi:hypothetical protein
MIPRRLRILFNIATNWEFQRQTLTVNSGSGETLWQMATAIESHLYAV